MHSGLHVRRPDRKLEKWHTLPIEEKKRQFEELVRSPYWHFLPDEIQGRIKDLIAHSPEASSCRSLCQ